jgi:hypothetical protein
MQYPTMNTTFCALCNVSLIKNISLGISATRCMPFGCYQPLGLLPVWPVILSWPSILVGNVSGHLLVAESKSLRRILPQNTKLSGTRGDLHCLPRKWRRRRGFAARLTHFHWVQSRNLCWYLVLGDTRKLLP